MFDDAFRGFDLARFGMTSRPLVGWPHIEVDETDKEVRITAELASLDEDVNLEIGNDLRREEIRI